MKGAPETSPPAKTRWERWRDWVGHPSPGEQLLSGVVPLAAFVLCVFLLPAQSGAMAYVVLLSVLVLTAAAHLSVMHLLVAFRRRRRTRAHR